MCVSAKRFERFLGYRLASLAAAIRLLFTLRPVDAELHVDGEVRRYSTPMVFIGVGERELRRAGAWEPSEGWAAVLACACGTGAARGAVCWRLGSRQRGVAYGIWRRRLSWTAFLVDRCQVGVPGRLTRVAVDGEIVEMQAPITYRIATRVLNIVVP